MYFVTPIKDGLFEGSFLWGWGSGGVGRGEAFNLATPSYFKKNNLSNINITLYNC